MNQSSLTNLELLAFKLEHEITEDQELDRYFPGHGRVEVDGAGDAQPGPVHRVQRPAGRALRSDQRFQFGRGC